MPKKNDIQVQESEDELKKLMPKQKSNSNKNKVKMLLLLKQGKVTYSRDLIPRLKVCRRTIYHWLRSYDEGGLKELLAIRKRGGIPPLITEQTKKAIAAMLADPKTTITSYVELLAWVHKNHQSNISYQVLYNHCRKHHNSVLIVSRKSHHTKR